MSSSPSESLAQKWLRQNVATYNDGNRVFADVDSTLSLYNTLHPKTDVYTYDDGRTQLLLCVHGLLPITYRQASYHIPIAIWLARHYPREPPLAFVVPTSDMLVRPSKYVDVSGLCRIEYILNWEKKYEGCDLPSLIQAMQRYFSDEPPVYSKPNTQSRPSSSRPIQQQEPPSRPPPPIPRPPMQPPPPIASPVASSPPSLPPRPLSTITPAVTPAIPPSSPPAQSPLSIHHNPIRAQYHNTRNPPPKPPLPPPSLPQPLHSPAPTFTHNRSTSTGAIFFNNNHPQQILPSRWHGTPSVQPPEPDPTRSSLPGLSPISTLPYSPSPVTGPDPIPPPPLPPPPLSNSEHPSVPPTLPRQRTPSPPHPNFLDEDTAVDVTPPPTVQAAPPRPPNPELLQLHSRVHEKLRAELASLSQVITLDSERLRAQQTDLLTGIPAIRDEMGRLEAVRDVCRGVVTRLLEAVQAADSGVAELKRKGDPPVDELVCSTSIVHNQLVDLVAEDNAIEDTIYHLHRALNAGRIDLDRFLRTTRVLAEEQFMKRALIERIQTSLPMGASVHPGWS